jgi:hypothetical protein
MMLKIVLIFSKALYHQAVSVLRLTMDIIFIVIKGSV